MTSQGDRPPGFAHSLKWMGVLLMVMGLAARFVIRDQTDGALFDWLATLVQILLIVLGAFLLYRGKQYAARTRAPRILGDDRPPVVYLRPFAHDESMASLVFDAHHRRKLVTGLFSTEEQLAEAVAPIGPLVAIGQPGERLPTPGAARAYASDAEWKDVVERWLSKARLVIVRPGTSQGVWWELERVFTTVRPERVLVLLLGVQRADYESFAASVQARFGIVLPHFDTIRLDTIRRRRFALGFLAFSDGWKARFLPLRAPFWRRSSYKLMRRWFHYALQPVFLRLEVDWRPMPISILTVLAMGVLGLLAALIVSAFVSLVKAGISPQDARSGSPGSEPRVEASLPQAPPAIPAPEWSTSSVAGLQLSAPGTFEPMLGRDAQQLRERLGEKARELEAYQLVTPTLFVQVGRMTFEPGIRLRLDAAVQGQIRALARQEGVGDLRHSTRETRISGHRALRVSVWFTQGHQDIRYESLSFDVGQTLWMVVTVVPDTPAAEEALERILDSVRLVESRF